MLLWVVVVLIVTVGLIVFLLASEVDGNHRSWTASLAYVPSMPSTTVTSALVVRPTHSVRGSPHLLQITCESDVFCLGVGFGKPTFGTSTTRPASKFNALLLTNRKWEKVSLPTPPTPPSQLLMNVACARQSACVATGVAGGSKFNPNSSWGDTFKVAGSGVVTMHRAFPLKGFVGYDSDCVEGGGCLTVGKVFHTSGGTLAILSATLGMSNDRLNQPLGSEAHGGLFGLSCPSPTRCYAVGSLTVTSHHGTREAVIVEGHGTRWRRMPLPLLEGHSSSLASISCVSATTCVAVGSITRNGVPSRPVALELVGGSWRTMSVSRAVRDHGDLTAVTCLTATDCLAVGDGVTSTSSPSSKSTATSFQGGAWQVVPVPKVTNMNHLACLNPDECFAISGQDIVEFKR